MQSINLWPRLTLAVLFGAALSLAGQQQATMGKIHGHISDPAGVPQTGTVSLFLGGMSSATQEPKYTFQVDASGDYKGDVAPGSYTLVFRSPNTPKDKIADQIDDIKVTVGADTEANDDMSRPEYMNKLSPEERKAIEETKAKNAAILKENSQIKNLNADLAKARSDRANKDFNDAVQLMQHDVAIKPDQSLLWVELGEAQLGLKQYSDAETSLQKGIQLDQAAKKHGATVSQLSLAWLLHRSPVMLPIPGTSSVAHLEENVKAAELKLSDAEWKELEAAARPGKVA